MIPKFLPFDHETWISSEHDLELSITPTPDGYQVSLWLPGGKCITTASLNSGRKDLTTTS